MSDFSPSVLQAGDSIIYLPDWWNPVDLIIAHKTWQNNCHIETYIGENKSVAARLSGVRIYESNFKGVGGVIRPIFSFDMGKALSWFYSKANGQGYDLMGLFNFYRRMRKTENHRRMWCSEFSTRFYRAGDGVPFNPEADADMMSPAQFCQTSAFRFVWRSLKMPV